MHALEPALEALKRDFDAACVETGRTARRQVTLDLNQIFRRLRHYENEDQWINAVRDASSKFASDFGIFTKKDGSVVLRAQQNLGLAGSSTILLTSAQAFSSVLEGGDDPVVTLRTPAEVGSSLSTPESSPAHLFPISNSGRVVALIFAVETPSIDLDGLELLAGMASSVLERQANRSVHSIIEPLEASRHPKETAPKPAARPSWTALSDHDRGLHVKAQRFSRVAVAQLQLARPEACREGRKQNNLYMFLQGEIDRARDAYRKQFMAVPSMIDYLHLELLNTAAAGDERKLGADYPGQLV